jgi:transposase
MAAGAEVLSTEVFMARWDQPKLGRDQIVLFSPTLEDSVTPDHSVRLFDEVIGRLDFAEWEKRYDQTSGRPPIHPRVMASVILYGLSLGIRSSRKLENSTQNRIDFLWLTQGRVIDHATLAGFRVRFADDLKGMFRQIGRVAINLGMANLNQVALDGTVKRANNSRQAVSREDKLRQKVAALDEQVESLVEQSLETDRQEDELHGESSPTQLPRPLRDLKARRDRLAAALKKAQAMEAGNKPADQNPSIETTAGAPGGAEKTSGKSTDAGKSGDDRRGEEKPARSRPGPAVPTTDPDASLMKNKNGGFAPNYLVVLATEGKNGLIVDYQVPATADEPATVLPAMANLRESFGGRMPGGNASGGDACDGRASGGEASPTTVKQLLADGGFNSGANLDALQTAGITPFMAPKRSGSSDTSDPAKTFDKSRFTFDAASDQYRCPAGRSLPFWKNDSEKRGEGTAKIRVYRSTDCGSCALSGRCLSAHNKSNLRTIGRDQHEPLREQMAARLGTDAGRATYRRRSHLAETPFAVINTTMNVTQLLLRGRKKVTAEIGWICSAFNLMKITRLLRAARQPAT